MATLGEIVGRVMDLAPRETTGRLQQDILLVREWVVARYRQVLERWPWSALQKNATPISTLSGTASYTLATDFWRPISFRNTSSAVILVLKPIEWLDTVDPKRSLQGSPRVYTIFGGNTIELWPVPDGVYSIQYRYIYRPPDPVYSDDSLILPNAEMLVFGALSDAYTYLGGLMNRPSMLEQARAFEMKYNELIASAIAADRALVVFPETPDESSSWHGTWLSADELRKVDSYPIF